MAHEEISDSTEINMKTVFLQCFHWFIDIPVAACKLSGQGVPPFNVIGRNGRDWSVRGPGTGNRC